MQHVKRARAVTLCCLVFLGSCSRPATTRNDFPAPIAGDTTAVGAYASVLRTAWDSVFRPDFALQPPIPIILWDTSVSHPLQAGRSALPTEVLRGLKWNGLVSAHCPGLGPDQCTSKRPIWWTMLVKLDCNRPDTCESGFQEFVMEGRMGPRLDGSAWSVVIRRTALGWTLVRATRILSS